MYQLLNLDTGEISEIDNPRYVCCDERGVWTRCEEKDAQCIALDGVRFSLANKEPVEDAPQVLAVKKIDAAKKISQINLEGIKNAQNIDEVKAAISDITDAVLDIYLNGLD